LLLAVAPLAACVGSESRQSFEDEVHARGGGLSQELAAQAVDAVESELHVDSLRLRSLDVTPGHVGMEVQVPHRVEDLDRYGYGTSGMYGGGVARSFDEASLEAQVFTLRQAGVDHLDETVDRAVDEAGLPGGYATGATVVRLPGEPDPQTAVTVTNVRRTITVTFGSDGSVLDVQR
jgi:hypothetical protein